MGGRGGRSHGGGGGGQQTSYAQYATVNRLAQSMGIHLNLNSLGQNNINPMYIQETLQSVQFIYTHFPVMAGRVQYIDANVGSSHAYASAGGDGGLHMGLYGRMTPQALARQWAWDVRSGFHPQGTQASGIFVHEMGHQVEAYLNRRDYGDAWAWGRSSSDIVLQAAKRIDPSITNLNDPKVYQMASDISRYAVDRRDPGNYPWAVWETVAEAVQDYGTNNVNVKPLSVAIWKELKRRTR